MEMIKIGEESKKKILQGDIKDGVYYHSSDVEKIIKNAVSDTIHLEHNKRRQMKKIKNEFRRFKMLQLFKAIITNLVYVGLTIGIIFGLKNNTNLSENIYYNFTILIIVAVLIALYVMDFKYIKKLKGEYNHRKEHFKFIMERKKEEKIYSVDALYFKKIKKGKIDLEIL